jgi:Flp pilus assembly protein TadG
MLAKLITSIRLYPRTWVEGAAAVELAIVAPLLVVLVLGVANYGALMNGAASLEGATRAVAEFARNSSACGDGLTTTCTNGITSLVSTIQTNNTSLSSATFTPSAICTCVDGNPKTGAGITNGCPGAGVANPCASITNPATGATDPRVLQYIQIQATQNISPLVSYGTYTSATPLTAQTTTRIQ